jgi:hypothetical protein
MTPLQRAETLHRTAAELLQESAIISVLSQLGQVHMVGSYRFNVMFRPDIDLIVTAAAPSREHAVCMTRQLLDCGRFQTVGFADWFSYRKPNITRGSTGN